jgi:hypothetical protein
MPISSSRLRQIIQEELLREAMFTSRDLVMSGINLELRVDAGMGVIQIEARKGPWQVGHLEAFQVSNRRSPCYGAYEIKSVRAQTKGLGPLMYEIAMEAASAVGGGLISDRMHVSSDALRVWTKYKNGRPDVDKLPMDDFRRPQTPDPDDDCDVSLPWGEAGDEWPDHPLSQAYRKNGLETIKDLRLSKVLKVYGMDI